MNIKPANIPMTLTTTPNWVLWRLEAREAGGDPTKVPYQPNGVDKAKAGDATTWGTFLDAVDRFERGGFTGIGYEFAGDGICGIDLDGCRDPATGKVADWARDIIRALDSYSEVSPSQTGVKIFIRGTLPSDVGRKRLLPEQQKIGEKSPAIEVYDRKRYFAVTGWRLAGVSTQVERRQPQLDAFVAKWFPAEETKATNWYSTDAVLERARKYVAKMPPAVTGSGGHNAAFKVACVLVLGFQLHEQDAYTAFSEWNQTCQPPWSEKEIQHKIRQAAKQPGERGYLRNQSLERWSTIKVPDYQPPAERPESEHVKHEPKITTIVDAARLYIESLTADKTTLIETGIGDLDYAIGGGIEPGELFVVAARPSHGKSAVALQAMHHWTLADRPVLIISEEMSARLLGKRTMQFASDTPEPNHKYNIEDITNDLEYYASKRAPGIIAESCGSTTEAIQQIEKHIKSHKIQAAIIDYAQILQGVGKNRYEQVSNTSIRLKQLAVKSNLVVMLLCQLNREIEDRNKFVPRMADIRESGQIEQDADVIIMLVWPHKINPSEPAELFQVYVAKNRNRPINQGVVKCRFVASRQMVMPPKPEDMKNFSPALAAFNNQPSDDSF